MKLLLLAITFFAFLQGHAQVANTKWHGTMELDSTTKVILHFSKDTLTLTNADDSKVLEILTFVEKGNVVLLQKAGGKLTDCDKRDIGIYKFVIKDNVIVFSLVDDDCNSRSSIIDASSWDAVKEEN